MYVDTNKAVEVFSRLLDAYQHKKYPYNLPGVEPPQVKRNLPIGMIWGSREHACFLFVLCYWMRGGIDSHTATRQLTRLYSINPNLFKPEFGMTINTEALSFMMWTVGLGFNKDQIAKGWKSNWQKIFRHYEADPRKIFAGILTYEEACKRIQRQNKKGFFSFQEKMVSMITYFYMDAGIVDRWHFPIPVDFHVLRICFANEIVVCDERDANGNGFYTKAVLQAIRDLCMWYCKEFSVDPIILCEVLWLFSRTVCDRQAGNRSVVGRRNGRKTVLGPVPRWSLAQTRTFERTCGICMLRESCKWNIASAVYYIQGRIDLRGRREEPLQRLLFPIIS